MLRRSSKYRDVELNALKASADENSKQIELISHKSLFSSNFGPV